MTEHVKSRLRRATHVCLALSALYVVGHWGDEYARLSSIQASTALADCFEALGAIISMLGVGYLEFERSDARNSQPTRHRRQFAIAVVIVFASALAASHAQSASQLYFLRTIIGLVEGMCFLAGIVRLVQ